MEVPSTNSAKDEKSWKLVELAKPPENITGSSTLKPDELNSSAKTAEAKEMKIKSKIRFQKNILAIFPDICYAIPRFYHL